MKSNALISFKCKIYEIEYQSVAGIRKTVRRLKFGVCLFSCIRGIAGKAHTKCEAEIIRVCGKCCLE